MEYNFYLRVLFTVISLCAGLGLRAQDVAGFFVGTAERMTVHDGQVAVFGDAVIGGPLALYPASRLTFRGERWTLRREGVVRDESVSGTSGVGGLLVFGGSRNGSQYLISQNSSAQGAGLPSVLINSSGSLILESGDLHIRGSLNFQRGHLLLNGRNLILAPSANISGYNDQAFIVTGSGVSGGTVSRWFNGTSQEIVFPIGTVAGEYTPAAIIYSGPAQQLSMRVFNQVFANGASGAPDDENFVPKTWVVRASSTSPAGKIAVSLQHQQQSERPKFTALRSRSFISRYLPTEGKWDVAPASGVLPGKYTTGLILPSTYVNTRESVTNLQTEQFFAKSVNFESAVAALRIPEGISPNNDGLNEAFVIQNLRPGDVVRLEIYNRWQSLVYRDLNYKNDFTGVGNQQGFLSNELPDGTYYYTLSVNGEKPVTGHIIINR